MATGDVPTVISFLFYGREYYFYIDGEILNKIPFEIMKILFLVPCTFVLCILLFYIVIFINIFFMT